MNISFSKGRRGLLAPWAVAGVSAVVALGAVGCGGDNTPETTLSPGGGATETQVAKALTKAQYIEEADARCSETNASIQEYVDRGEGFSGAGEMARRAQQKRHYVHPQDLDPAAIYDVDWVQGALGCYTHGPVLACVSVAVLTTVHPHLVHGSQMTRPTPAWSALPSSPRSSAASTTAGCVRSRVGHVDKAFQ